MARSKRKMLEYKRMLITRCTSPEASAAMRNEIMRYEEESRQGMKTKASNRPKRSPDWREQQKAEWRRFANEQKLRTNAGHNRLDAQSNRKRES